MPGDRLEVQKVKLHCPSLEEIAKVLEDGLSNVFEDAEVSVVDCPDLTKKPFNMAAPGLCGSPRMADVGGVPNLVPFPRKDRIYNLEKVAELSELPGAFVTGAGAGPFHVVGYNSEMMANVKAASKSAELVNKTHVCSIDVKNGGFLLEQCTTTDFAIMGNLFISEGLPGKVLEVKAEKRTEEENFVSIMRKSLADYYGNQAVGLGGMFSMERGKLKTHVMPDFSDTPLDSNDLMDDWLRFFEMSGPFNCMGVLISHDPDLDLRVEHFHGYNEKGEGGHYHFDTTPDDVKYRGYFSIPEYIYRIDRPSQTHRIGRD